MPACGERANRRAVTDRNPNPANEASKPPRRKFWAFTLELLSSSMRATREYSPFPIGGERSSFAWRWDPAPHHDSLRRETAALEEALRVDVERPRVEHQGSDS